jgi:hypothetical protein
MSRSGTARLRRMYGAWPGARTRGQVAARDGAAYSAPYHFRIASETWSDAIGRWNGQSFFCADAPERGMMRWAGRTACRSPAQCFGKRYDEMGRWNRLSFTFAITTARTCGAMRRWNGLSFNRAIASETGMTRRGCGTAFRSPGRSHRKMV